jgi:hypothetical protein
MNILPVPPGDGKSDVANSATWPTAITTRSRMSRPALDRLEPGTVLDGSRPPIEVASRPYQSIRTVLPTSLFDRDRKVPASAYKVAQFLEQECERFTGIHGDWQVGVWTSAYAIADQVGYSESTVRDTALRWLQETNDVALQEVVDNRGRLHLVIWCKWRGPGAADGVELPTGAGSSLKVGPGRVDVLPNRARPGPERACSHARSLPRETAQNSGGEFWRESKTTDRVNAAEVVVPAAPGGEGSNPDPEPAPCPAPSCPAPSPAIPARILEAVALVDDPADRAIVEAEVPGWLASWPGTNAVENVWRAIVEAVHRGRRRKLGSLAGYIGAILRESRPAGRVACRVAPRSSMPPAVASGTNQPIPCVAEAERAAMHGERSEVLDREGRWLALAEPERDAFLAEWDRDNPRPPSMHAGLHKLARIKGASALMDALRAGTGPS